MPAKGQYRDSIPEINNNWMSISDAARRFLEKSVEAMNAGNSEIAEAYHAKAIDLEAGPNGGAS